MDTASATNDRFTFDIIENSLQAISDEMFAAMRKTSMSAIIYEVLDMGTGITDARGEIASSGAGIPAFFTPTGYGTIIGEKKEVREFNGRPHILEHALKADFALIKAWKGDKWGNLIYRKTARNFNPMMATAARVTIAEVEELVEVGELDGDQIITPSVYVKRIFQGQNYEKRIERRTVRQA